MVPPPSSDTTALPIFLAAIVALALPWLLVAFTASSVNRVLLLQLITFFGLAAMLCLPRLRVALMPRALRRAAAHRVAMEQFMIRGVAHKNERTGVLIFVSVAEHFAEIIADAGINEKVAAGTWQAIVDQLTKDIGNGQSVEGFVRAVEAVGRELARHFPPGSHDPHAFANHLIVLPSK